MAAGVKSLSNTFVWILMGLLIIGLAGFGALNLTGTVRTVATVGEQTVTVDDFARELQREMRALQAQTGQPVAIAQARAMGLDRQVLSRLVALAALDHEVAQLGISIGDVNLQKEIVAIPAFNGIDGKFDRESYRFALQQAGLNETQFEADLRAEAARTLVQGAIVSGVVMPDVVADTLANYIAERRSFSMLRLDAGDLAEPVRTPTEDDLKTFYEENPDLFTLPETKKISYVMLTPAMMLDQVEVEEDATRALFEKRAEQYNVPERRLVERLVFPDEAAASEAMAQLEVGGTTFETLVRDRGLAMGDVDMGDLTRDDLGDAADAVFGAEAGKVVGPLPSALGPALYRINGVLAEQVTAFEDVRDELRDELAQERARRLIATQAENINDLLAGGATFDELANETDMQQGSIDWTAQSSDGIAAYESFREVAAKYTKDDYPEVEFLEDGGIFAMQVDEVLPPRPEPFDQARVRVLEAWNRAETAKVLRAQAEKLMDGLGKDGDFAATGYEASTETDLTRTSFVEGTPADFMNQVFEMEPGETRVISGGDAVFVVRLERIAPPEETEEYKAARAAFGEQLNQALARELFDAYARDVRMRARPEVDERAVNAVMTSFQ